MFCSVQDYVTIFASRSERRCACPQTNSEADRHTSAATARAKHIAVLYTNTILLIFIKPNSVTRYSSKITHSCKNALSIESSMLQHINLSLLYTHAFALQQLASQMQAVHAFCQFRQRNLSNCHSRPQHGDRAQ